MKINTKSVYRKMFIGLTAVIISIGGMKYTTTAKSVEASTPCIVTIFGIHYDVSPLGTMHSGPQGTTVDAGAAGFFQCETDMTTIYQNQHGTNVSRLSPFIYTPPTTTPTPSVSPSPILSVSPVPTISQTPHHEELDDDENEIEDEIEEEHEVEKIHQDNRPNHGQEVRSVGGKNRDDNHDED